MSKGLIKRIGKNSWKVIPFVGFVAYNFVGINKDKEKEIPTLVRTGKVLMHILWTSLWVSYSVVGASAHEWNPKDQIEDFREVSKKNKKLKTYKAIVTAHIDSDENGLSNREDYKIKELMGVQDSSKTYAPSFEDWERAYNRIKTLE